MLEKEGFSLSVTRFGANVDPVEQAFGSLFRSFQADGVLIVLFSYESVEARDSYVSKISIQGQQLQVTDPPQIIELGARGRILVKGNLVLLLVSDDAFTVNRIAGALESIPSAIFKADTGVGER